MALQNLDTASCSEIVEQLGAAGMQELAALIGQIERRYPGLARRLVVSLGGYEVPGLPIDQQQVGPFDLSQNGQEKTQNSSSSFGGLAYGFVAAPGAFADIARTSSLARGFYDVDAYCYLAGGAPVAGDRDNMTL